MGVPYTFATATTSIPLSQLDANFNTQVTIGTSTVGLGNTTTSLVGLSNVSTTALTVTNDASISGLTVGKGLADSQGTAFGNAVLSSNTTGFQNVGTGYQALKANTTGYAGSAFGAFALTANTTGNANTAVGRYSMITNTTGSSNTAIGEEALQANTTASNNTAVGYQAGYSNTTGTRKTAIGYQAGYTSTVASYSTYVGSYAGNLSTGEGCTYIGDYSGSASTTATYNTFLGQYSGAGVTTGGKNTIVGCYSGNQGGLDIRTANNYIVLSDGDGNPRAYIDNQGSLTVGGIAGGARINSFATATGGRTLYLSKGTGDTTDYFIVADTTTANRLLVAGTGSVTNATGVYGTISDIKLKENIVDATPKLAKVLDLKVRNFNLVGDDLNQIGFIAQELEQVFPSMVEEHKDTDANGGDLGTTTKSIKTSILVPILVKAIQELNATVVSLQAQVTALTKA